MNLTKDFEVTSPPDDSISSLAFSPTQDLLAGTSWDNKTRIWEVMSDGSTQPKAVIEHQAPVLSCAWSKDGTKLCSAGADKAARMMDLATGQTTQIGAHDMTIKSVRFVDGTCGLQNCVVTGSWDKTLKFWDLRASTAVATVQLPERVYAMDVSSPLLVAATADRQIHVINLSAPTQIYKTILSTMKWQTRDVACFHNATGFAVASIEGRVGIHYIDDKDVVNNFSFKCHREEKNVFAVNALSFHPIYGTFATAGSDGSFNYWCKDSKQRLKVFPNVGGPISATAFNKTGSIYAYAVSYDWSKGHEGVKSVQNKIFLHAAADEDIKTRSAVKKR